MFRKQKKLIGDQSIVLTLTNLQYNLSDVLIRITTPLIQAKATKHNRFFPARQACQEPQRHLKMCTPKCSPEGRVCLFGTISGVCLMPNRRLSLAPSCIFSMNLMEFKSGNITRLCPSRFVYLACLSAGPLITTPTEICESLEINKIIQSW